MALGTSPFAKVPWSLLPPCISPLAGLGRELGVGERKKDGPRRLSSPGLLGGGLGRSEAETAHGVQVALLSSRVDEESLDVWKFKIMPLT